MQRRRIWATEGGGGGGGATAYRRTFMHWRIVHARATLYKKLERGNLTALHPCAVYIFFFHVYIAVRI